MASSDSVGERIARDRSRPRRRCRTCCEPLPTWRVPVTGSDDVIVDCPSWRRRLAAILACPTRPAAHRSATLAGAIESAGRGAADRLEWADGRRGRAGRRSHRPHPADRPPQPSRHRGPTEQCEPGNDAPPSGSNGGLAGWFRELINRLAALWSTPRVGRVAICSPVVGVIAGLGAVVFLVSLQFMYREVLGGLLHFQMPPTVEDRPHADHAIRIPGGWSCWSRRWAG